MAKLKFVFSHDEINEQIPYPLICETRYGAKWDITKNQRRFENEFTEEEREHAKKLFILSHIWYLKRGVPEEVEMTQFDYDLWAKLATFCGSL